jgi:hypothetical protein
MPELVEESRSGAVDSGMSERFQSGKGNQGWG